MCAGIIPWNFPLVMAVWKIAPALADGQHVRAQAGLEHAADRAAPGRAARRDRPAQGRGQRHHRRRRLGRRGARLQPGGRQGRVHRLDRGRAADHAAGLVDDQEAARSSSAASRRTSSTRTRTSTRRSTARCGPRSSTRARCASRARGCSCPTSIHDEFVERLVGAGQHAQARRHHGLRHRPRPARLRRSSSRPSTNYVRIGREEGAEVRARRRGRRRARTARATSSSRRSSPASTTR